MSYGFHASEMFPNEPYQRPCIVVPDPDDFKLCGRPSGTHTALDYGICDECWEFLRES